MNNVKIVLNGTEHLKKCLCYCFSLENRWRTIEVTEKLPKQNRLAPGNDVYWTDIYNNHIIGWNVNPTSKIFHDSFSSCVGMFEFDDKNDALRFKLKFCS